MPDLESTLQPAAAPSGGASARWWYSSVKWGLFAVVLYFVGRALLGQLRQVDWSQVQFRPGFVIGSVGLVLAVFVAQLASYRFLLAAFVKRLPWRMAMAVTWVPLLGKYVPGKVTAIATAVYLLRRFGVSAPVALSVTLLQDGLAVLVGLMLGTPLLFAPEIAEKVPGGTLVAIAVIAGGIVCIHPAIFGRLLNFGLKQLRRPPLPHQPRLRDYALPAACGVAQWVLYGGALWLMSSAVTPGLDASLLPRYVSIAALAMTASYLAIFAPGGFGVREGIFLICLSPSLGASKAAIVVVAMRVLAIAVETALFGVGLIQLRQLQAASTVAERPPPPPSPQSAGSGPA